MASLACTRVVSHFHAFQGFLHHHDQPPPCIPSLVKPAPAPPDPACLAVCAVAKGQKLLGMGSGQPNRVKSVQIALEKAGEEVKVSAAAWKHVLMGGS